MPNHRSRSDRPQRPRHIQKGQGRKPGYNRDKASKVTVAVKQPAALAYVLVDLPNVAGGSIDSDWSTRLWRYKVLTDELKRFLLRSYAGEKIELRNVLFDNRFLRSRRLQRVISIENRLKEDFGWETIIRPRIRNSDIDENIVLHVDFILKEYSNLKCIFFVGSDLENTLPLMFKVKAAGVTPVLVWNEQRISSEHHLILEEFTTISLRAMYKDHPESKRAQLREKARRQAGVE